MRSEMTLRARLTVSYSGILAAALVIAALVGIIAFDRMVGEQAQRVVDGNMSVAAGLLEDTTLRASGVVADATTDAALTRESAPTPEALAFELERLTKTSGLTYMAYVTPDGTVQSSSVGTSTFVSQWPLLRTWAADPTTAAGVAIVPDDELSALGLTSADAFVVKETDNGTVVEGEADGALSIVAAAPFRDGILLAVRSLKLDFSIVDSVVEKVGGTATIFQRGVRVATTVLNAEGERAIGTVVSDEVREATLDAGEPFRGEAFVVNKRYLTAYEPLRDAVGETVGMLYVGVDKAPYAAATRNFGLIFGGVCLVALVGAAIGAMNISRALARPLAVVEGAAADVATGNLTVQVPSVGYREIRSLAGAFNSMTSGLTTIIDQVEQSVAQLHAVSSEITAASRSSAEHATHQASSVAQTTATLEELTRSFQAVADGARRVLHVAEDALESAQDGMSTVAQTHGTMDELASGAQDMATAAGAMAGASQDITEMTEMITGIAGQTKILALNAAIEAARAGEAGKGFAVVSTEIRALAESVAESANRISELITGIQGASDKLQGSAARQAALTQMAVDASEGSRRTFASIVQHMEDTALAAREITEATVQQTRASDQLVDGMQQVAVSSNQTAAAARQLADAANAVEIEAEQMMSGLSRFQTR